MKQEKNYSEKRKCVQVNNNIIAEILKGQVGEIRLDMEEIGSDLNLYIRRESR